MPGKKEYLSVSKGVHNQKLWNLEKSMLTCKNYIMLSKKASKFKYWVINVWYLETQMVSSGWSKNDSACICSAHQNVVLLVDTMDRDLIYKDLMKKIVCNTESNKCIMYQCESCPDTAILKEFLDQELNEHLDDEKFNYCQWDTMDQAILTIFPAIYEEYKETLIDVIDDLTRHSYTAKRRVTIS